MTVLDGPSTVAALDVRPAGPALVAAWLQLPDGGPPVRRVW